METATPYTSNALTPAQWRTFYAITSAILPASPAPENASPAFVRFAESSGCAENEPFRRAVEYLLDHRLPAAKKNGIGLVLSMLNSTAGCMLLTYSSTLFHEQPVEVREEIVKTWTSPTAYLLFPPIRRFALSMIQLTKMLWLRKCTTDIVPVIDYCDGTGVVNAWTKTDAWKKDAPKPPTGEDRGFYDAWNFIPITGPTELSVDVVIVGSGCGGAVAAKIIAESGLSVIVVEKGTWVPADQLPMTEDIAFDTMFEEGVTFTTDDGGIAVLAGSTFGGGGAVNWAASLQPPHYVRNEWAQGGKLPFFHSPDFQRLIDAAAERMGVSIPAAHNHRNTSLLEGAHKLGYTAKPVPQNAPPSHYDAFCTNGCGCPPDSRKMGTQHTFLPDASRAGARFITSFKATSLLFSHASPNRVTGISGVYGPQEIPCVIRAREVVLAAGSLHSPALLLNSGLTSPHIGAHLHLHPAIVMHARFPHEVRPGEGSPLTALVSSFEDLDGKGHGVRLETPSMGPGLVFANLCWTGGQEWKQTVSEYQRLDSYIAIIREEHTGRVYVDSRGKPRVDYVLGAKEQAWALAGYEALAKIAFVQGADKIWSPVTNFPPFIREPGTEGAGVLDPAFQKWLAGVRKVGMPLPGTMMGSAHQMGTCRMAARKDKGVVDMYGRVFGYEGVVVADASVLPSASGVNPMLTIMGIAGWVAEGVVERVKREKSGAV